MGLILFSLFWGVVLLEEIERIPTNEWERDGLKKVFFLRRTRTRFAFLLALTVGLLFLGFEIYLIAAGRGTFNFLQALGMAAILLGCYFYAVGKKGPRK
jgi:hypothetical protein